MSKELLFAKSTANYLAFQFTDTDSDEFYDWVCDQMGIKFKVRALSKYPRESLDEERHETWGVAYFKGDSYNVEIDDYVVVKLDDEASSLEVLNPGSFALKYRIQSEFAPSNRPDAGREGDA